ncbi:MAG: penicillin-binding protein activator LpoB [Spirochaetales bacterium]|nr:penicillin-binding protein activator LpoB [Spirochaetales bacterium]
MKIIKILLLGIVAAALLSCSSTPKVTRVEVDSTTDLSGYWNDTDSRLVAEQMVRDSLARPWLMDHNRTAGQKPVVIVGTVQNKSSEHIETAGFIHDIERELINSGQVRFVQSPQKREEIRREIEAQGSWASADSAKRIAQELGADFMMQGTITSTEDRISGKRAVLYQVDLQMVNIETTEIVWIGNKKIKKLVEQSRVGW